MSRRNVCNFVTDERADGAHAAFDVVENADRVCDGCGDVVDRDDEGGGDGLRGWTPICRAYWRRRSRSARTTASTSCTKYVPDPLSLTPFLTQAHASARKLTHTS
eukprot:6184811-Pleurochrysis_carterae.AAC.2